MKQEGQNLVKNIVLNIQLQKKKKTCFKYVLSLAKAYIILLVCVRQN
jgi:hypothetical protein